MSYSEKRSKFVKCQNKPSWVKNGNFFQDKKMDEFRLDLLKIQFFCNNFTKTPIPQKISENWDIIDATHHVNFYSEGNFFKGQWLSKAFPFLLTQDGKDFTEANNRSYRAIALRHKPTFLISIFTAGTDCFDNVIADGKLYTRSRIARDYCHAGELFTYYIRDTYLGGEYPSIFIAHSLGCSFNMWMNGITGGNAYILNTDAFCGSEFSHQQAWERFQTIPPHVNNIDSIIGSPSFLNNYGQEHVGHLCKLETYKKKWLHRILDSSPVTKPVSFGIQSLKSHSIENIAHAYEKKLRK